MTSWLIILLIIAVLVLLNILAVRKGGFTGPRGSFTGMTVYHDWVNQDAQRGVEVIVKRNAGEKESEDESGEPTFTPE